MPLRKKAERSAEVLTGPPAPAPSEMQAAAVQKPDLRLLAVPAPDVAADTKARMTLITKNQSALTQPDLERLMNNVKLAQQRYTEGLNTLSEYRKAVALLLEKERRAAAAARKQSGQQQPAPEMVIAVPVADPSVVITTEGATTETQQ